MVVKMTKIRIMGPKGLLPQVTDFLHGFGRIHVESRPPDVQKIDEILLRRFSIAAPTLHDKETLEIFLEQVKKILLLLPAPSGESWPAPVGAPSGATDRFFKEAGVKIESLAARLDRLVAKKKVYTDELSILERYEKILQVLSPLISQVRESRDLDYLGIAIRIKEKDVIPLLEQAMARMTQNQYEIFYAPVDDEVLAALLVFPKDGYARVKRLLLDEDIGELRLPSSVTNKPLGEAFKIILHKRRELPRRIKEVDRELAALSARWYGSLAELRSWLENKISEILISASFYETKMTFVIYGWVPSRDLEGLRRHLADQWEGRVVIDPVHVDERERERIPVFLDNPRFLRPFEQFTRILPLPKYGTIDPTPYIAIFFPLFFGMIIGDIGYGALLLIAAAIVRKRFRGNVFVEDFASIFTAASVSSILWGVLYGEFFGDLGEQLGLRPILMNRMGGFLQNLYLALAVGVVHILLGIGLGIFTAVKHGNRREIWVKFSSLGLMVGFLLTATGIVGFLPKSAVTAGLILALASVALMIIRGGAAAAMEIHNLVNILSYLRLMGIGVASVALAFAANKLGGLVGNVVLGILIASILHALNLIFGIISPTIQSLRLHYVEFFENFFQGGGLEYKPFKKLHHERSA
ncbi:MAG TPA: V-type ATPase 116kDa subunit family protein [Nitrospiria bacterium]|nr:V-type ATPase 116kDa subunit family protein [Nitrospiria bacterium]